MINPIAFRVFGFDIRWYGILIAIGISLATYLTMKQTKNSNIDQDSVLDIILVSVVMGVVGARIYYVLFSWDLYKDNILEILDFRSGGLAIHGGLIFGITTAYFMSRIKKLKFIELIDIAIPNVALAQSIGRWGNYFNMEAHGGITNLPWGIEIDGEKVHPTFLYESIWCLLLFFILRYMYKKREFNGQIFLMYAMLYSLERFFVEGLRTDSLMFLGMRQAQIFSISTIILCGIIYGMLKNKNR